MTEETLPGGRRVWYIDTGSMPVSKIKAIIAAIKIEMCREYYDYRRFV